MKKREYLEISIILPCRNEEKALPICLKRIKEVIKRYNLNAEIIVSDSSTDNSPKIAKEQDVILIKHDKEGYGIAYLEAIKKARGKYIFMADSDATYDFNDIPRFVSELKKDNDLVIGNRFSGIIEKNAMPFTNRYIGNPILSSTLRFFFSCNIKDTQCGMRSIKKQSLEQLNLKTQGMEFASEMLIKAIKHNLKIKQIPINYYKRIGSSKLRPFSDAWKHFRFMLLYSPIFLFLIPGILLFILGIELMIIPYLLYNKIIILSSFLIILGYQLIFFSIFAKTYQITKLDEESIIFNRLYSYITIERAVILSIISILIGIILFYINNVIALTIITLGVQTIFYAFMLSILGIKEN
jgi:glycosyltransferase involved in cell wall biosynthesis